MGRLTQPLTRISNRFFRVIDKYPFASFLTLLALLFVMIVIAHFLRKPPVVEESAEPTAKSVSVYQNGTSPSIELTAQIEKQGVITIVAQSAGVVQKIPVHEGMHVKRGTTLVSLSTNYLGASLPSVSRQISQKNAQFNNDNYNLQKETIAIQRSLAENKETKSADLRDIDRKSIEDTKNLINLNQEMLNTINNQISKLELINVNGSSDSAILSAKQSKSQLLASLNGLRSGLRNTEYSSNEDEQGAQIERLNRDLTLKQLDLQEKSLDLNKDVANLQLKLARINESLMYPTTPCPGIVERIFVKVGQVVNPGTPLAVIRADNREITAVLKVTPEIAARISRIDTSTFTAADVSFSVAPRYVSSEPTDGNLHTILYSIPGEYEHMVSNGGTVAVSVPLGIAQSKSDLMYIPLDSVYQTQDSAFIYRAVEQDGKLIAKLKEIELGRVAGQYVQVTSGLEVTDTVILTRGLSDGQVIKVE